MKKISIDKYSTIVDKIIAEGLPPQDALVKMLEIFGNIKVVTPGGNRHRKNK
jgi:hypothetical protein